MIYLMLLAFLPLFAEQYIVFLVEARHLNLSSNRSLIRTIAKHPSDGSKNSDVGHAWIYLYDNGDIIEGGHSGETGTCQPRYLEGVHALAEADDPNPIRYLFTEQRDGYFECGSGGHRPTYAARIDLTPDQMNQIKLLLKVYPFHRYSLTDRSCCHLIEQIGYLLNLSLDSSVTIQLEPFYRSVRFWTDDCYSTFTFGSPDKLQGELKGLVALGIAQDVTVHFNKTCPKCALKRGLSELPKLPGRTARYLSTFF